MMMCGAWFDWGLDFLYKSCISPQLEDHPMALNTVMEGPRCSCPRLVWCTGWTGEKSSGLHLKMLAVRSWVDWVYFRKQSHIIAMWDAHHWPAEGVGHMDWNGTLTSYENAVESRPVLLAAVSYTRPVNQSIANQINCKSSTFPSTENQRKNNAVMHFRASISFNTWYAFICRPVTDDRFLGNLDYFRIIKATRRGGGGGGG